MQVELCVQAVLDSPLQPADYQPNKSKEEEEEEDKRDKDDEIVKSALLVTAETSQNHLKSLRVHVSVVAQFKTILSFFNLTAMVFIHLTYLAALIIQPPK